MKLSQAFRMAFRSVLANKLRTALSMLGMLIGVATVIALVSMSEGSSRQVQEQVESLGAANMLQVSITGRGLTTSLSKDEAMEYGDIDNVEGVSPIVNGSVYAKYGTTSESYTVEGITPEYADVRDVSFVEGRYIVDLDLTNYNKVALIGANVATDLFDTEDPVGQTILLNGNRYKVVGLLETKGDSLNGSADDKILIPLTTAERLLSSNGVKSIYLKIEDTGKSEETQALITAKLAAKFPSSTNAYRVVDQQESMETLGSITQTMTSMMAGIAMISLIVGGIGIMNIMLVSVTERTREIGIRKSLGAKRRDILTQFLIEAVAISGLGGVIGIVIGYIASNIIGVVMDTETAVSLAMVGEAFAFSAGVGVIFGIFPANKAARLRPVDALRHD
ncbi:putative ABC transport system permease protein [Paenibacillus cellulosilyticus]|uniref:Putative ABC transport system permease protein n=1 Tax=Paenibacillus cellulosilyticus TaxID=375489 RepID=A0A2V2Z3K2_9BACL|nr:ABC transporter permease [Paenibacillus cellulosilyticus]PWW08390.1 putative ABC transport system permease protein [Paenibacillus cellulosilyticus]QKS47982.1 ABC transporter permease [Paenibacillus cellulosilyticus]